MCGQVNAFLLFISHLTWQWSCGGRNDILMAACNSIQFSRAHAFGCACGEWCGIVFDWGITLIFKLICVSVFVVKWNNWYHGWPMRRTKTLPHALSYVSWRSTVSNMLLAEFTCMRMKFWAMIRILWWPDTMQLRGKATFCLRNYSAHNLTTFNIHIHSNLGNIFARF